jgi:predicted secreted protein
MPSFPSHPVSDLAPDSQDVTTYDLDHFHTYNRLLECEAEGVEWRIAAAEILHRDTSADELGARRWWESHLARGHWLFSEIAAAGGAIATFAHDLERASAGSKVPLGPPVADRAPQGEAITKYDWHHLITYLRLLDAEEDGADWREVAKLVLYLDPAHDENRARIAWQSHLERAHWLTGRGYRRI